MNKNRLPLIGSVRNMSSSYTNSCHLVQVSPYPILVSIVLLGFLLGLCRWLTQAGDVNFIYIIFSLGIVVALWFRDILREAYEGAHTQLVQRGFMVGFLLFIVTEVMLFFSFFWAFFNSSLSPDVAIGSVWPPYGLHFLNPWSLPFLGSTLLLSSGFILTLGHHAFLLGDKYLALFGLTFAIVLGGLFLGVQFIEYSYSEFTISDGALGSVFYMTTGLHAIHVIAGVLFLLFATIRIFLDQYTMEHHVSFEMAIYYYHLVDIVWLFVFFTYYYWGS